MRKSYLIAALIFLFSSFYRAQNSNDIFKKIIPIPQKIEISSKDNLSLNKLKFIVVNENIDKRIYNALKNLIEQAKDKYGANLNLSSDYKKGNAVKFYLDEKFYIDGLSKEVNEQSYSIEILKNQIIARANNSRGLFYAIKTLEQIFFWSDYKIIPCANIIDYPDMNWRGISDDISRGQVSTIENFKKIISIISKYKMNLYMPYIEDVFEFDAFPEIGKGRGALSKEEAKMIVDFARENFIEVIPIFQTLGHYENILSIPQYVKYAEFPGAACLNVSSPEIYKFLETAIDELIEIFPSEYFHIGADESYDVALGESSFLLDSLSLAEIHLRHYLKIYDMLKKKNKKILIYSDMLLHHREILDKLPKDILIVDWHYRPSNFYSSNKLFKEKGFNYFVSPSVWNFTSNFPVYQNALPNIYAIIQNGIENNSIGMINSCWGDFGSETFRELNYWGYVWSAQCSWNIKESNLNQFSINFFSDYFQCKEDKFYNVFLNLSVPLNQVYYYDLWQHPLLKFREPVWWESRPSAISKKMWIDLTYDKINEDIKYLKKIAKNNKDNLDILALVNDLNKFYSKKIEFQIEFEKKREGYSDSLNISKFLSIANECIKSLEYLKKRYEQLWLMYYKNDNLDMILEDKFNRLIQYFIESIEKVKLYAATKDMNALNPEIKSSWLTTSDTLINKTMFAIKFNFDEKMSPVLLQLIADSRAILYINDEKIDEVFARGSLSFWVERKRIKLIDITSKLKIGENTIKVEVYNYGNNRRPAINIASNIEELNTKENSKWQEIKSDGTISVPRLYGYRTVIIEPNFKTGRKSFIQRR